jgi:hypothetical protein
MGPKTIVILAVLTLFAVIAAGIVSVLDSAGNQDARIGTPVFPDLLDRVNDVATLSIASRRGTLTLVRGEGGWRLLESDGFQVMSVKARGSVLDLAALRFFEQKTAKPDRYYKLFLRDIADPYSESKRITLKDAAGDVLADLVVGLGKNNLPGTDTGGVFIRLPGDKRTWLAQGGLNVGEFPSEWIEREIFNIAGDRIKRVEITRPSGETLVITKRSPMTLVYSLNAMPSGSKIKYDEEPGLIASNLEKFLIEDARRAGTVSFAPGKTARARFETFDGLSSVAEVTIVDQQGWVRFSFIGTGAAASEAQALSAKTRDWVFRIAGFRAERLTKRLADMLAPADN